MSWVHVRGVPGTGVGIGQPGGAWAWAAKATGLVVLWPYAWAAGATEATKLGVFGAWAMGATGLEFFGAWATDPGATGSVLWGYV